ncbi:MAG: thioredoxin-disulfide reductase [Candidatus Jidaibacter sp.]|jgi:thioredoxin reductase (NADPH)|nr:thioredoxin-disulfide reductase [Candidatus Jidaibacter sp.]
MQKFIPAQVLIIGSGPAGYSAAIYASRAGLDTLLVTGSEPGGQLTSTTDVENYPGFAEVIQGPWLMEQMEAQAKNVGVKIVGDKISEVDFTNRPFICKSENGEVYSAQTVIISTGAQAKWLGVKGESKYQGFGVSGCATCDAFFYRGKEVLVVGGGNTAVEEAIYLTNHASKVTVVHRRDSFRAEKIAQDRLFSNPKISVIWDTVIDEVLGEQNPLGVTGALLKNVKTGALTEMKVDGIFVAIGHLPNTAIFKGKVEMDEEGYIITKPDSTETNIPGVFAAGDVQDKIYRQAITAAGTGCMAALQVNKFLQDRT